MVLEEVGRNLEGEDRNYDNFPSGMRVLAVDGDPVCLKVLECLLRKCGYQVTTRSQATMALKMLRENKDRFDLVISDVHLPDMDGFKFLELIGLEMDLPVIMLSANSDTKLVMRGITHGACDYLVKPVRIKELRNIWQHVIRREKFHWKTQSESAPNLQILDRSEMNLQLQSSNSGRKTDQAFPFDIDYLWAMERGGNKLVSACENGVTQDDGNAKQNVGSRSPSRIEASQIKRVMRPDSSCQDSSVHEISLGLHLGLGPWNGFQNCSVVERNSPFSAQEMSLCLEPEDDSISSSSVRNYSLKKRRTVSLGKSQSNSNSDSDFTDINAFTQILRRDKVFFDGIDC